METVLLRQTPAGEQSALLRNQDISEQNTSHKKISGFERQVKNLSRNRYEDFTGLRRITTV